MAINSNYQSTSSTQYSSDSEKYETVESQDNQTVSQLEQLYEAGYTSQGVALTQSEAIQIIMSLGIDFGEYKDDLTIAIQGMTGIQAFIYLINLISAMDVHDGGTDDNNDFKLNSSTDITSIFINMNLGYDNITIGQKLIDIAKTPFKDIRQNDESYTPNDQQLIDILESFRNGEKTTPNINGLATMDYLAIAFGSALDLNQDGGIDTYQIEYSKEDSFTNTVPHSDNADGTRTAVPITGTDIKIESDALNLITPELLANGDTELDANGDGIFNQEDLKIIAARDNDDPNLDDTIITKHELETVMRGIQKRKDTLIIITDGDGNDTGIKAEKGAWELLSNENGIFNIDVNRDGIIDIKDAKIIAARDNDDPNLDDTIITKHEAETVLQDIKIIENR